MRILIIGLFILFGGNFLKAELSPKPYEFIVEVETRLDKVTEYLIQDKLEAAQLSLTRTKTYYNDFNSVLNRRYKNDAERLENRITFLEKQLLYLEHEKEQKETRIKEEEVITKQKEEKLKLQKEEKERLDFLKKMILVYDTIKQLYLTPDSLSTPLIFSKIRSHYYGIRIDLYTAESLFLTEQGKFWKTTDAYPNCPNDHAVWEHKVETIIKRVEEKGKRLAIGAAFEDPCSDSLSFFIRLKAYCSGILEDDYSIKNLPVFDATQPCFDLIHYYIYIRNLYTRKVSYKIAKWRFSDKRFNEYAAQLHKETNTYYIRDSISGAKIYGKFGSGIHSEVLKIYIQENEELHQLEQFLGSNKPIFDQRYQGAKDALLSSLKEAEENGFSRTKVKELFEQKTGLLFPSLEGDPLGYHSN
ncbi:MAG: hypothetical protein MK212_12390 [Saprospiraceae bacterium]|nr:hypothetical protein [Saprospiraceae bacterium]